MKKIAVSTQLKNAKSEIALLNEKVAKLEKEFKSANDNKDMWYKKSCEFEKEIEQVHALLDALPGSWPRKTELEESWQRKDLATMTRLAAYLANRGHS